MPGNIFTAATWGSTAITGASGDWTRYLSDLDMGTIEWVQFSSPSPTPYGGDQSLGPPLPQGRRWGIWIDSVFDGSATNATGAHWDEMEFLQTLFNPGSTTAVELKTLRPNTSSTDATTSVARSIWCYCTNAYPAQVVKDIGSAGIVGKMGRSRIRYRVDLYSPFPLWRDTTASTAAISTTDGSVAITNNGQYAAGVKVTFTTATSVTQCTVSNDANSYAVTFATTTTTSVGDFYYTDPTVYTLTNATVDNSAMLMLTVGTNTLSKSASGTAGLVFTYRRHWGTP